MAKILVVDDEEYIRLTLGCFMEEKGHEVIRAADFDQAIGEITQAEFDLVIADVFLGLGGKTGTDLLRECRAKGKNYPVVLITGYSDVSTARDAVRLGAFDYLAKPIEKETLLQTLDKALKSRQAAKERDKLNSGFETILRSVEEVILTVNNEFVVTGINEGAKPLCGFGPGAKGRDVRSLVTGCSRRCLTPLEETLKTGQSVRAFRFECHHNSSQPTRIINVSCYPIIHPSGESSGAVMILRDEPSLIPLQSGQEGRQSMHHLIGGSEKMQKLYSVIESLADVDSSVLVVGESGTGKEMIAEALHYLGKRAKKPLVKVNCSALLESLLESELFGHVKGAFTGAATERIGRFQKADGGTIFLDEIGDLSPKVQSSLLRVLQQREFERVGDSNPIRVDVRVVAATNKDLNQMVQLGKFREDLMYRLRVVEIFAPPLRERLEDIPLLVEHFLAVFNKKMQKRIASISLDVEQKFQEYGWPGNIRELEHALEHAFVLCNSNVITMDHLPVHLKKAMPAPPQASRARHSIETAEILQALEKTSWNKKRAAELLGIDRKTLYRNMARCGITNPGPENIQ
ncbi:MAG TPA: sigma 54-interacting transcriptional regulator [Acidobacteriota bacterium]|nr:sigma 54-interacting transcriptional regulator [Acidobacteriota bacterium]